MKIKLLIQGMDCASCASNIERSLKKIIGIKEANVNVMTRKAIIETEKVITDEELKKAVSRAGNYKVVSIEKE